MKSTIAETVYQVLNNHLLEQIKTDNQDDDLTQYGMDSIIFIKIVVDLEDALQFELPDEKLLISEMDTMNKIICVIDTCLKSN